jgi:hypothetical protein
MFLLAKPRKGRRFLLFLAILCSATSARAGNITKSYTFSNGDTASATAVNTNFDQLFTEINNKETRITTLEGKAWSVNGTKYYYTGGNVGIGTNSPNSALEVIGNGRFENNTGGPISLVRNQSGNNRTFISMYQQDTTNNNGGRITYSSDTTGAGAAAAQQFGEIQFQANTHNHATRSGSILFGNVVNGTHTFSMVIVTSR